MEKNYFSQKLTTFHGRHLPEEGYLAGYAMLVEYLMKEYAEKIPLPKQLAIVTSKHQRYETDNWQIFTKRSRPDNTLPSHLTFALKHEGIDLYILKKVFQYSGESLIKKMVDKEPTGQYARKVWFLYEWLLKSKLNIPDLKTGTYVEIVNPKFQYPGPARNSTRHRVKNNLPGTPEFCPLIRKTIKIESYKAKDIVAQIEKGLEGRGNELIKRTAAFLLIKDSKASFAIEGEYPPNLRARNWGKAIGQAGKRDLSIEEIERLQHIVIGQKKLKHMGIRQGEGFIGEHDRDTFSPIPDHISARAKDLASLLNGLIETNKLLEDEGYDPILAAAAIAFGFVFIHPLSDGNGRIHRYLIHHILTKKGFKRRDMIFPVSAAILNRIGEYQEILEEFSNTRIDLIAWQPTRDHNVEILSETVDLYRYFDATLQAEFLLSCVEETIEQIIPAEIEFLERYDQMAMFINEIVSLPDNKVDLLIKFIHQNKGKLSKNKRQKHFSELTEEEIEVIEEQYSEVF